MKRSREEGVKNFNAQAHLSGRLFGRHPNTGKTVGVAIPETRNGNAWIFRVHYTVAFTSAAPHFMSYGNFYYYRITRIKDETATQALFRLSCDFRSVAAVNSFSIKYVRSWAFVMKDLGRKCAMDAALERLFSSFVVHPDKHKVQYIRDGVRVLCYWPTPEIARNSIMRYFDWHDKLPQIIELNVPPICQSLRNTGIRFCQQSFPETIVSWDIECNSTSDKLPCGRNPQEQIIQIAATIFRQTPQGQLEHVDVVVIILCRLDNAVRQKWQKELKKELLDRHNQHGIAPEKLRHVKIIFQKTEELVLATFQQLLVKEDPTCTIGYNTSGFDVPFLKDKQQFFYKSLNFPVYNIRLKMFSETHRIDFYTPGRAAIDMMMEMKQQLQTEFRLDEVSEKKNMSLDYFAKKFLGFQKAHLEVGVVEQCQKAKLLWEDRLEMTPKMEKISTDLIYYGVVDTILPYLLNTIFGSLETKRTVAKIFRCPILSTTMEGVTSQYPYYYHTRAEERQIPLPCPFDMITNNSEWDVGHRASIISSYYTNQRVVHPPYEGAIVTPKVGRYQNVGIFDFASLYPSVMRMANLSRESIIARYEDLHLYPHKKWTFNRLDGVEKTFYVRTDQEGILPELLRQTLDERKRLRAEIKTTKDESIRNALDARQKAAKVVSNSVYGGSATGIFADRRICEYTTAIARSMFFQIYYSVMRADLNIINGDTDSIMVPDINPDQAKLLVSQINSALVEEFGPLAVSLEYERHANVMWVLNSKKYVFQVDCKPCKDCHETGKKIIFKGMKTVKGDTPPYIKNLEQKVITTVLDMGNDKSIFDLVVAAVDSVIQEMPQQCFRNFVKTQKVKSPDSYSNRNLPQVQAALQKMERGEAHISGDRVKYVLLWTSDEPGHVDDQCVFYGKPKFSISMYKRTHYISSDDPILDEPFGLVCKKLRVYLHSILESICTTAQAYFASVGYEADRERFRKIFTIKAKRFLPNYNRAKTFPLNKSVPAGLNNNLAPERASDENNADKDLVDGAEEELDLVVMSSKIPKPVLHDPSHIYNPKIILNV